MMSGPDNKIFAKLESERLAALADYRILDSAPEPVFDGFVQLAAQLCRTPIATITLLDADRQWFKAQIGLPFGETTRALAFCDHAIRAGDSLTIPDTLADLRFADNPLVTGPPFLRFYSGVTLMTPDGLALGTVSVMDHVPRQLTDDQLAALRLVAAQVMAQLEARKTVMTLQDMVAERDHAAEILREEHKKMAARATEGTHALERADAASRKAQQLYRLLWETTTDAVLIMDADNFIQYANASVQSVLGHSPDTLTGKHLSCIQPARLHAAHLRGFEAYVKSGIRTINWRATETTALCADGSEKPVEIAFADVVVNGMRLFVGFFRDISERKRAEELIHASEQRFRNMFRKHKSIMLLIDPESGKIVDANLAAAEFYGYGEDQLRSMVISQINVLSEAKIREERKRALNQERNEFIFPHRLSNGEIRTVEIHSSVIDVGDRLLLFSIVQDITERRQAEESMRLASLVYQNSSEAMAVSDPDGTLIAVNPAFTNLTGYAPEDVLGKSTRMFSFGLGDHSEYPEIRQAVQATGRWRGEIWSHRKNGEAYAQWLTINSIFNEDGSPHRRVALFYDITQKKETEELIWRQANFDTLTGLPNRHMFLDRLVQEIKKAHRSEQTLALMFLDLDHFKEVNDTLGHDSGDDLLKEAARRLRTCVREADTVARLGGDEFAVVLSESKDQASVEHVAHNILKAMNIPFLLGAEKAYVSTSIGIKLYPRDATNGEALLKNADQAMYAAKNRGRDRFHYFAPFMQEEAQARMRLVRDLRGALANDQFRIVYQPIVNLADGSIHKAEALIRWQHPVRGLVSPIEFIQVAEDTGIIIEIGEWVFRQAAQQVAQWRVDHCADFTISINTSPAQFHKDGISHHTWQDYLHAHGLPGESIVVEITEGLLLDASPAITDQLLAFRDGGIGVALDDFGTGYSSLSYLKKFDIDYIKIDRSFVMNLEAQSDDMALCEAIIVMAHKLGLKVIAEGVETAWQRDWLARAGCDFGQGYLFSKPVSAYKFENLFPAK